MSALQERPRPAARAATREERRRTGSATRRDRRRRVWFTRTSCQHRPPAGAPGHLRRRWATGRPGRGLAAFLETGAFVGLVLPGRDVRDPRRRGRRAGRDLDRADDRGGLVGRLGRRLDELLARSPAGPGVPASATAPRVRITQERFARVEDYFSRHGGEDDPDRRFIGLVRALAPFTAGSSGMRYALLPPVQRSRHRAVGGDLRPDRLLRLAEPRSRRLTAGQGTFLFGIAVAVIVAIVVAVRFLRQPENRSRLVAGMERRRALRPLVALGAPGDAAGALRVERGSLPAAAGPRVHDPARGPLRSASTS